MAVIINDECTACGTCLDTCPTGAIVEGEKNRVPIECPACLPSVASCPPGAIVRN